MKQTFQEVSIKATKSYIDGGKRRTKTKKFYQTLNPFNVNAAGVPKTQSEIMVDLRAEMQAWLIAPGP